MSVKVSAQDVLLGCQGYAYVRKARAFLGKYYEVIDTHAKRVFKSKPSVRVIYYVVSKVGDRLVLHDQYEKEPEIGEPLCKMRVSCIQKKAHRVNETRYLKHVVKLWTDTKSFEKALKNVANSD